MNKILLLFWTLILSISPILSQPDPPQIILRNGIQANWTAFSIDPNMPDLPSNVTKYSNSDIRSIIFNGNKIYTLAEAIYLDITNDVENSGGPDGLILHCIDQNSGEVLWRKSHTKFTGNTEKEGYWSEAFRIRDDGDLEVVGYRDNDPTFSTAPKLAFTASPIRRIFDKQTGELIDAKYGNNIKNGLHNFYGFGGNIIASGDDNYFNIQPNPTIENGKLVDNLYFFNITDNMDFDSTAISSVQYHTELPTQELSLSTFPNFTRLRKDTLLALFGVTNPVDLSYSPAKMELHWIDIKDKYHPKTVLTKDVHYAIQFPSFTNDFFTQPLFKAKDNTIIFYKRNYGPINGSGPNKDYMSLLWMDEKGNQKAYIKQVEADGNYYQYPEIIVDKNGIMYFSATIVKNGRGEMHILKVKEGTDFATKVSELVMVDPDYTLLASDWKLMDNGHIFLSAELRGKIFINQDIQNHKYPFFQSYKAKDLGIDITVNTTEVANIPCEIYPNPTSKLLNINTEATYNKIEIYDGSGKLDLVTDKQENIDISGLSSGIKIVNLSNNNKIITSKKIIKIE
jgi:Secretion system C-terminal sorting domain